MYTGGLAGTHDENGACCSSCAAGGDCESHGLGFSIPDDGFLDQSIDTQADGSLFNFGSVENLASVVPASFVNPGNNPVDMSVQAAGSLAAPFTGGLSMVASTAFQAIEHLFHFGAGRHEANMITPIQNVIWQYIVNLSQVALASNDPRLLQQAVLDLQQLRFNWLRFLADPRFRDGRASAQAANTIMPYLDGSCGYSPHAINTPATPAEDGPGPDSPCMPAGCNGCSNAWPGNFGNGAGLLGALRTRVVQNGGLLPPANDVTQGVGVPRIEFPGTSGATNLGPQSGFFSSPTGWVGGYTQPQPPIQFPGVNGFFGLDSSTLMIGAAVLFGVVLLRRG